MNMTIDEVETRMNRWTMTPPCFLASEVYTKLAFAIGKDVDLEIIVREGRLSAAKTAMSGGHED